MRSDELPFAHPWVQGPIREYADVIVGGTPSTAVPQYWGGEVKWMTSSDVHAIRIDDVAGRITERGLAASNSVMVLPQAVAIALAGQGKTRGSVALTRVAICTNQSVALIKPRDPRLDVEFLFQSLIPRYEELRSRSGGGGRAGLSKSIIDHIPIQIPPLPEQRRIAGILGILDEAIDRTGALIAKTRQISTGMMHDLFTRGVTQDGQLRPTREAAPELYQLSPMGWLPREWEICSLGSCLDGIDAGHSPNCPDMPASAGEWGVLKVGAVNPSGFRECENKVVLQESLRNPALRIATGDLLLSRANTIQLVGAVSLVESQPENLMLSDKTLRLRPDASRISSDYLFLLLQTHASRRQIEVFATGTSGSMKNIGQLSIRAIGLGRPSTDEQSRITDLIRSSTAHTRELENTSLKLRRLKSGLMQDLLTGTVRVALPESAEVTAFV